MVKHLSLLLIAVACLGCAHQPASRAQTRPSEQTLAGRLKAVPIELYLADSSLRVVNVYKIQATILLESTGLSSAEVLDRLTREVYAPFGPFWRGYLGDETAFRTWAETKLLAANHPIHTRLPALIDMELDSLFTHSAEWLVQVSARRPQGVWYIVFGPGWTNMGGLRDLGMVADFTQQAPDRDHLEFALPHELTHMVHEASPARRSDPDAETVLHRIISEGLASYATYAYAAGARRSLKASGTRTTSGHGP
jgi:hypothetical protein